MNGNYSDYRLILCVNQNEDHTLALWFCETGADVDAMPCNACAFRGTDFEQLKDCAEYFFRFPAVFLAISDKEKRDSLADALSFYLPSVRVILPAPGAFSAGKTVAEIVAASDDPAAAVDRIGFGAREAPCRGLLDIGEVKRPKQDGRPLLSGFADLDRAIGGFRDGELTVITGKRGGGKSTLVGQFILESIEQGRKVALFSGELSPWMVRSWLVTQAAGREHLREMVDNWTGQTLFSVCDAAETQIVEWLSSRLFLFDRRTEADGEDAVLNAFELAVLRYGCSVFVVDNLMALELSDADIYRAQSAFVGRLCSFAKMHNAVVFLVAHPRKGERGQEIAADDVAGASGISDRADNVLALRRLDDGEAEKEGYASKLVILKNRGFGASGYVRLDFDKASRRLYRAGTTPNKRYGWQPKQTFVELPNERTPLD